MRDNFYGISSIAVVPITILGHFTAIGIYMGTPWDWKYTPIIGVVLIILIILSASGLLMGAIAQVKNEKFALVGITLNLLLFVYQIWFGFFQKSFP